MPVTPEQVRAARALLRLEQAELARAEALYQELRAISIRSAERLAGREQMTEDDLYDENGLPA